MERRTPLDPVDALVFDRDGGARFDPEVIKRLTADDATAVIAVHRGRTTGSDGRIDLWSPSHLGERLDEVATLVYLGVVGGRPTLAAVLDEEAAARLEPEARAWFGMREALGLHATEYSLFVTAVAVGNWHESNTFCPRCGAATTIEHAGWMRRCTGCGREIFPRTDPAVIVRVLDDDGRILLGSNALWENNRYSLFAGFVEAGESFEEAAIREVREEAGVTIAGPRYLGSQPWPLPQSIMIGMEARAADPTTARADGTEILDVRWFTREEIQAEGDDVLLPGSGSIARTILEDWYGGPLDQPPPQRGPGA
ncbi:NAD(+) diphosphatase [Gryllotalpicola sp.]|uniref:NAD(+) diphosphatase n=1 Tax=Gryllotalpicola sp. TaxID=1932787 RepID=UPI00261C741A|nr:NAD(+) diphosphatase [Gryllotalpicola sp.]